MKVMKKAGSFLAVLFSLFSLSALPWVEDAFLLVETDTPKNIQHAIETDYSFKDFTRFSEKENLLMAALKNARGNDVVDLLLKQAKISPESKTTDGITALMYACQYETDINAIESVLFTGAKSDSKKAKRILSTDKNGLNCFDYARKNEMISTDVLNLLRAYADEPVAVEEPKEAPQDEVIQETVSAEVPETTAEEESLPSEEMPEVTTEPPQAPAQEAPSQEKNTLIDFTAMNAPFVIPESIYLYDYANDKYSALEIPASLIAAEQSERHFISDANRRDANGRTKLMLAVKKGDISKIEDLLYSGAEINAKDKEGWTALMYAARFQKNADVTKLLLYKGADRTIKNKYGITALMLGAGYSESCDVLSLLLDSYNPDSDEAREAFAYGISNYNKPEVLQAFLDKQVPVNIPYDGKTPLMLACQTCKDTSIIEWLLENGASKYQIEAATGKTAFDYAKENKRLPHNTAFWSLNPNS
ncbi:ankyrin repeat domain-containing protein [uncultured Treponema sp.]|uniref:ankyrin repeat domain-containing protein n=1 Tax=uncultured Treponema sp. TaxID=162155 RepID=UPI0025F24445|nr:ankyrin repeat domain-containing protein [uncultured Treponema sp.]